jgi:GTP-binding protein
MPGVMLELRLELKLLADVGLVGLPNAGKSTLLGAVSHAAPEVGDFPFTTLEPVLGVVDMGIDSYVMADLPGLIEGAHAGVGLGHEFLRHIERTRVIVHLLDASQPDPVADYLKIRRELSEYAESLATKREVIAVNKIDIDEARERVTEIEAALPSDREVFAISGATGEGVRPLIQRLHAILQEERPEVVSAEAPRRLPVIRPRGRERMEVVEDGGVFVIHGEQALEAAVKLGPGGDEALDELQDRLKRQGLDRLMRRAGARPGDVIRVGDVELEWVG